MAGAEARVAPLPSRIGRHAVVGYIATGGMAELFLGKEPTGRPVVIKRILPHLARQTDVRVDVHRRSAHRLAREASEPRRGLRARSGRHRSVPRHGVPGRREPRRPRAPADEAPGAHSYGLCAYIIAEVCDGPALRARAQRRRQRRAARARPSRRLAAERVRHLRRRRQAARLRRRDRSRSA